jgi:hypothetical protein
MIYSDPRHANVLFEIWNGDTHTVVSPEGNITGTVYRSPAANEH